MTSGMTDAGRWKITEGWHCALVDRYGKPRTEWRPVRGEQVDFGFPKVTGEVVEARVRTRENEELVFPLDVRMFLTSTCSVSLMLGVACSE